MVIYKRIFLGHDCNNNCLHCETNRDRSAPRLSHILAEIAESKGHDSIELVGGEPTLRPDFFEILNTARNRGFRRIKIVTNARAFADINMAAKTIEAGCHLFEIKVHHCEPAIHDRVTQVGGSFDETVEGISNLRYIDSVGDDPLRAFIHIVIPVSRHNYENIGNVALAFAPYEIDRVTLSFDDSEIKISEVLPHVKDAMNASILNRLWITTRRIPLCAMMGLEHHVSEIYSPPHGDFEKDKQCDKCVYDPVCPGIVSSYFQRFGFRGLGPVLESEHAEDIRRLQHEED